MKKLNHLIIPRLLGAAIAAAALITPGFASAQDDMSYNSDANQQISGTIAAINDTWNITVRDVNGYADSVELHQGTIINPTGLTLEPGMNVTIDGYADGQNFDAMEIDTPYQYQGPAPEAVYYGAGVIYPGYVTGWGPSFSLFFDLNSRRFERRTFAFGGEIRRPMAPPAGWENRPHGFLARGSEPSRTFRTSFAPQQQRSFARPQQQERNFAPAPQQQRSFARPQEQQRNFAPAPQQQQRNFAPAPQQQRSFARPQEQPRSFAPAPQQQQRNFAPAPQQQRQFAAPQQARRSVAPAARAAAPAAPARGQRDEGGRDHHGR